MLHPSRMSVKLRYFEWNILGIRLAVVVKRRLSSPHRQSTRGRVGVGYHSCFKIEGCTIAFDNIVKTVLIECEMIINALPSLTIIHGHAHNLCEKPHG